MNLSSNLINNKPYRSKHLKDEAKAKARKREDGAFSCTSVPVLYHSKKKQQEAVTE